MDPLESADCHQGIGSFSVQSQSSGDSPCWWEWPSRHMGGIAWKYVQNSDKGCPSHCGGFSNESYLNVQHVTL